MKRRAACAVLIPVLAGLLLSSCGRTRRITAEEYVDRMKAGWVGQMAGVGWAAPTEFRAQSRILDAGEVPAWRPESVNQFNQDDLYVEMTFLRTLEQYGLDVPIRQAGIDFANSRYMLWHANLAGRDNLRSGVAPPWSGHPRYNRHADDIDYQIEADFAGLIAPGLPRVVMDLGETFGRLMNYGDGLYGGQFMGGMYAEAFFEKDMGKIVQAGLRCIPAGSQYHECISDVVRWSGENPADWRKTWTLLNDKYHLNPAYRRFSCEGVSDFNIDAKINGAYVVMGLLYGRGDPDSTIVISMRCGQDSDCNPSSAAGILFTTIGFSNLPERFTRAVDPGPKFSFTEYSFESLVSVCGALARQAVAKGGGRIETAADGKETFVLPVRPPRPSALETCFDPKPLDGPERFTEEEMGLIQFRSRKPEEFVTAWRAAGPFTKPGAAGRALFDIAFAPERGGATEWKSVPSEAVRGGVVSLGKTFGGDNRAAYLRTSVWSEAPRDVFLEIGSDDGVKVWAGGRLVHANNVQRGCTPGEDRVPVSLQEGWNALLVKVTQGTGGWEASACFTDGSGRALPELKYKAE
jgi:hypothetical protein